MLHLVGLPAATLRVRLPNCGLRALGAAAALVALDLPVGAARGARVRVRVLAAVVAPVAGEGRVVQPVSTITDTRAASHVDVRIVRADALERRRAPGVGTGPGCPRAAAAPPPLLLLLPIGRQPRCTASVSSRRSACTIADVCRIAAGQLAPAVADTAWGRWWAPPAPGRRCQPPSPTARSRRRRARRIAQQPGTPHRCCHSSLLHHREDPM